MSELIIYTKTGCPYCQAAMDKFQKDGVSFTEVNITLDPQALRHIQENFNAKKVPVIVRDGELVEIGWQGGG